MYYETTEVKMLLKEFDTTTQQLIIDEVEQRVQATLKAEDWKLRDRKERIRKLYEYESKLAISQSCPVESEDDRYQEMNRKILEAESKKERERVEFVEQKREQQKFLNCEEIRSVLSKQQEKAIKQDQWWQIKEKLALSKEKAKEEENYQQLILQNVRDSIKLEEETNKMKWQNEMCVRKGYEEQIEYKNIQKQNEIREKEKESLELQLLIQKNKEIETQEMREKKKKSEELAKEMKSLMEQESLVRQQRLREEKAMQEELELIAFADKQPNKSQFKEELDSYRSYLEELTLKRKAEERRFHEKLAELTKERERRQEAEQKKINCAREKLKQSVLRGREEQLDKKYEEEMAKQMEFANERCHVWNEVANFHNEQIKNQQLCLEKKREYGQQLLQQMQQREEAKLREKMEKLKEKEDALAKEEKLRQEVEYLVLKPPMPNRHPLQGVEQAAHFIPPNP